MRYMMMVALVLAGCGSGPGVDSGLSDAGEINDASATSMCQSDGLVHCQPLETPTCCGVRFSTRWEWDDRTRTDREVCVIEHADGTYEDLGSTVSCMPNGEPRCPEGCLLRCLPSPPDDAGIPCFGDPTGTGSYGT